MGSYENGDESALPVTGGATPFGHAMREHFLFDKDWVNLNHGSFGAYPAPVRNARRGYSKLMEAAPDNFIRYQSVDLHLKARERVAAVLNAHVDDCVFVPNATTGVNTVLRNLTYKEKDVVIYFDTIYGACEKTLMSLVETHPQLTIRKVGYDQKDGFIMPATHAEICSTFSQTISRLLYEGYNVRAAVFDTISSLPGCRYPFERLVKICKEYNILSVMDAAHAVGHISLDLTALDADFFTSNCHKWLFTPRACAVLHVPKRNQHLIRTSYPTSHGYIPPPSAGVARNPFAATKYTPFVALFQFVATMDLTPYYCVPAALNFRQNICGGEQAIYKYSIDIAQRGADLVARSLGTTVMDGVDSDEESAGQQQPRKSWTGGLRDCALANVLLPFTISGPSKPELDSNVDLAARLDKNLKVSNEPIAITEADVTPVRDWMERTMTDEYHTFVPVYAYQGQLWTRLSGQIYLELKDFEWLGGVLKQLCERVRAGEATSKAAPS